jgi:hypothetical protein
MRICLPSCRDALKNNPKATVMELVGMNHLLQDAKTGAPSEYNEIEETMSPTALKIITDWLSKNVLAPRRETAGWPNHQITVRCVRSDLYAGFRAV